MEKIREILKDVSPLRRVYLVACTREGSMSIHSLLVF